MEIIHLTKFTVNRIKKASALDADKKICIHYYSDCSRMKSDYVDKTDSLHLPNSGTEKMYFSSYEEREYYFYTKNFKVDFCNECFERYSISDWDIRRPKTAISTKCVNSNNSDNSIRQSVYTVVTIQELAILENNQWAYLDFPLNSLTITKNKFHAIQNASTLFSIDLKPKFVVEIQLEEQYYMELICSDSYQINDLVFAIPKRENKRFNKNIFDITIARSFYS
jgi:hypothetical protein